MLLLDGYVVLMDATMPVVGDPKTVNDSFVEQITANAQAIIDKAVELGVSERSQMVVGGHSYGAFMTANLLAHSDLFKRRPRPQRRLQPHAHALRFPERAAQLLGGAGRLSAPVTVQLRQQAEGAHPADPRRER